MVNETEILTIVREFGIQALMLLWFMFRTEKLIAQNTQALNNMEHTITLFFEKK